MILIYQELVKFFIIRPTSDFKEEKKLETFDFPEVVLCLEPGFNSKVLHDYGYKTATYYRGTMGYTTSFVGWNGGENETRSSEEILEDVLAAESRFLNDSTLIKGKSTKDYTNFMAAESKIRTLAYPFGRCKSFTPPFQEDMSSIVIVFNDTVFVNSSKIVIFLMDKTDSLRLYPNPMEMTGDPIEIETTQDSISILYHTKVSQFKHVLGDPFFRCTITKHWK